MCAIPGNDRLDTGQGWRTSSGKTEPIPGGHEKRLADMHLQSVSIHIRISNTPNYSFIALYALRLPSLIRSTFITRPFVSSGTMTP